MEANEISTADLAGSDQMDRAGMTSGHPEAPEGDVLIADPSRRDRAASDSAEDENPALLPDEQAGTFRARWDPIQAAFVDEPSVAVHDADGLVAEVMQAVARSFADERARLEARWKQGEDVSTEDLRVTLQRYRSFFNRLLTA